MNDLRPVFEPVDWMADALCAEPAYRDLPWFPIRGQSSAAAKDVCRRCLVRDECLDYALTTKFAGSWVAGIWAGTSERERQRIRAEAAVCAMM